MEQSQFAAAPRPACRVRSRIRPASIAPAGPVMRVVGGRLRGRTLAAPHASDPSHRRPAARAPVQHSYATPTAIPLSGARVLDLFAGTGALGIEALSRGAAFVLFIDDGAEARALLRENVAALGLGGTSRIFRRDATKLGPVYPLEPFSLAFLDPPYGQGLAGSRWPLRAQATG